MADQAVIFDAKGHVLFEVRGNPKIIPPNKDKEVVDGEISSLHDFDGDGIPEAVITAWSGGVHCCYTEFVFERKAAPRNVFIWYGREWNFVKSLDAMTDKCLQKGKNGRPLLCLPDDSITSLNGSSHNDGPKIFRAFELSGSHYYDVSEHYPDLQTAPLGQMRHDLETYPDDSKNTPAYLDRLAEFYARSILARKEQSALEIINNANKGEWLKQNAKIIRNAILGKSCARFGYSKHRILRAGDWSRRCKF